MCPRPGDKRQKGKGMVLDIAPLTGLQPWKWQLTGIGYSTAASFVKLCLLLFLLRFCHFVILTKDPLDPSTPSPALRGLW